MSIRLDHIGIACENLETASAFWRILGLIQGEDDHLVEDQGVTVRFFKTDDSQKSPRIELLEPTSENTPIGKFLQKRGPGIQQMCFEVDDIESTIARLVESGIVMIDEVPKRGAEGNLIAFVHPRSTGGVLVELTQKD
ncbi:MAG TPA: methylmalonyl-CoA epimerase [Candidatus Poseidoniales archaeon]|nr:MAG TPA: methylmalonyl-CoA epimerase [Candidatus Poseidoniales archaeon]HII62984.1 methylmalonyl-CoA epimerase [Candidatus Poseidoniaceae archaeon]|tara:strand:- start:476 stop:889 length:414 start_codon:yes stop_codon:yes gene_type:complete